MFPIFLIIFNSGTCNAIQVINDTVVKEIICDALKFFTTVKNNVSIATQNNKSADRPSYHGNILLNFVIFSCPIFLITNLFGISNTVVFRTYSAISGEITWEVIIFFALSLIEAIIYEIYKKKE